MRFTSLLIALLIALPFVLALTLSGCTPDTNTAASATAPAAPAAPAAAARAGATRPDLPAAVATDRWLGKWNGPEGTALTIVGGQGKYQVTVQNLDGPRTFQGSTGEADSPEIRFERDGRKETIRASTGEQTGMKWLSEKKDCLTVRYGEGYCRD